MGQLSQNRLKLGRISFLNVLPLYYPLETGVVSHPFSIVPGTPAYLNGLMTKGDLDLSVVSSIEYARHPERYLILPDLSISCRGPVKSVLLLSRLPLKDLSGETVLVSTQSHTSVALIKILLSCHLGVDASFTPGSCTETLARGERPAAFLAIGDEALRLDRHDLYPYRWDLGEAWNSWTGLPFVFAIWVIQRQAVVRENGNLDAAIGALLSAKKWGREHPDTICSEAARQGILGYRELRDYYQCLRYDLGAGEKKGLELFYEYLVKIGEVAEAPRLEICSPLALVA
jgi:chorismate dehydratase